jgi:hypothetical protein
VKFFLKKYEKKYFKDMISEKHFKNGKNRDVKGRRRATQKARK